MNVIDPLIAFLHETVVPLGAIGIFWASIIESIAVPIPSALVLYSAGFIFLPELTGTEFIYTLFFIVAIPAALGGTIGSYIIYGLGYWLGKPFFEKYGHFVGLSWKEIEEAERRFAQGPKDEIVLGVLRSIPVIPTASVTALAGIVRMRPLGYGIATFLGSIIRGSILAFIGAEVGSFYGLHSVVIDKYENVFLVFFAVLIVAFFAVRIIKKRKKKVIR